MALPNQPQDISDSHNQEETQEREPTRPRRTVSADDLHHNNPPQAIRLADGPGSGQVLVNRERLSNNVRGRAGLGFRTEVPPQPSELRLTDTGELLRDYEAHQRIEEATQATRNQQMRMRAEYQRNLLSQEQTGTSEATLQPHQAPAASQDTSLNSTQQLAQPGQPRSYMPSLRSQPEFYMTGVTTVNITAEPFADNAECTICLEPLSDDVIKLQACGHMFHTVCVQSWFDQSAPRAGHKRGTCPNCRHELYEPDPQYGCMVPPQNIERGVFGGTQGRFYLAPSGREQPSRREEATATTQPYRSNRRNESVADVPWRLAEQERADQAVEAVQRLVVTSQRRAVTPQPLAAAQRPHGTRRGSEAGNRRQEFIANFQRQSAEQEQNTGAEQAPAVTSQRQATTRRSRAPRGWSELTRGDQLPLAHLLYVPRDDPPAQEDAAILPPRTSSLPHGGATRRQQASQTMTDALRVSVSPSDSHSGHERANPDASDHVPNVDESSRTPSTLLGRPSALIPTVNRQPLQPRESRATLAARAIAQRRPLVLEPGLNNRDIDPPQSVQRPALNSQHRAARRRDSLQGPGSQGHWLFTVPQPDLSPALRVFHDLQHEQYVLLDRLREVQNQLDRHVQAADIVRERRTVGPRLASNHLSHQTQDDSSTQRPPPIAIPHLADPAISDLRSAREFPDRRAIGSGASIWAADYVTPGERNTQTQAPHGRQFSPLPNHLGGRPTADTRAWATNNNDQIPSSLGSTYSETSSAEQPASADNPRSLLEAS